jgi:hypothetical protein
METWSNDTFWKELKPKLRRLIPHCTHEEYSAYLMLMRVLQVIVCGDGYWISSTIVPNDSMHKHAARISSKDRSHTFWSANISGVEYELENISSTYTKHSHTDGIYVLTTEDWEATFEFYGDGRAGHDTQWEVSYFLGAAIYVIGLQLDGDVDSMYSNMLMAALSVPSLETGEVFYKGSPV